MRRRLQSVLRAVVLWAGGLALPAQHATDAPRSPGATHTSVYSTLDERVCRTVHALSGEGSSVQVCPGVGGYRMKVLDEDNRTSVTVVNPDGREFALRYAEVVTPYFSSVGPRAEWRMAMRAGTMEPVAVTVRLNVNEDVADVGKVTSYLVVSRVDGARTCAVRVLKSSASALDEARKVADHAREIGCLKPQ